MFIKLFLLLFLISCNGKKINKIKIVDYDSMQPKKQYRNYEYSLISGKKPVEWNSIEGIKRLQTSKYKGDFYRLIHHFAAQKIPVTCGPATIRIVLSALYAKLGKNFLIDRENTLLANKNGLFSPFFIMTERNIFNNKTFARDYDIIARQKRDLNTNSFYGGMSIKEIVEVFKSHDGIDAEFKIIDEVSPIKIREFRNLVKKILNDENKFLIVNYHLAVEYPIVSGHISPIIAYDEKSDSLLIMDVAAHLGIWTWVKLNDLYRSMYNKIDGIDRGYVVAFIKNEK